MAKYPRYLILTILLALLATPSFPRETDLVIDARSMVYSEDGSCIEASGSVEAAYKDISIGSERLLYNVERKNVRSEGPFTLRYPEMVFKGEELDYDIVGGEGSASMVALSFMNAFLSGKKMELFSDRVELTDAVFTTCDLERPHYRFSSHKITVYPEHGWVICHFSVFWIGGIPSMIVPIYVYDVRSEERGLMNTMPYPHFGSNDDEGGYVSQSLPWYINQDLNGNVMLKYSTKKYLAGGFDIRYRTNPYNTGTFMLNGNSIDPLTTVLNHDYSFGDEIKKARGFDFAILRIPGLLQHRVSTKVSLNEKINYENVSMVPNVTLQLSDMILEPFVFKGEVSSGFVTEESSGAGGSRTNAVLNVSVPIWEGYLGTLTPSLAGDLTLYGNGTKWAKGTGALELAKEWNEHLSTSIGYDHFFVHRGMSPYNYEKYRFFDSNRVSAGFLLGNKVGRAGIRAVYSVPDSSPQDIDYLLKIGVHCFSIITTYRAMRNEFSFSFALD